jgi:hypothetical protein
MKKKIISTSISFGLHTKADVIFLCKEYVGTLEFNESISEFMSSADLMQEG